MKFRCERDSLTNAIGRASRAVAKSTHSLIHQGLLLQLDGDSLTVTGSDIDLTIQARVEVTGFESGEVLVPSRLFVDVIRHLPLGAVDVTLAESNVVIRDARERSEFLVRTMNSADFVSVPEVETAPISVEVSDFVAGLKRVIPAARKDDSRPILTGVLVATKGSSLRLVATDSYRLGLCDLDGIDMGVDEEGVIVPSRALEEITKVMGDVDKLFVKLDDNTAVFEFDDLTVTTRLINGDFPSYENLIPTDHPNVLIANRVEMLDAIRRVRLVGDTETPIRINIQSDSVTLSSGTDRGEAKEVIENIEYKGEELQIAFNASYLNDGIEVARSDAIVLLTADALKPALLKGDGDTGFLYLLMPVRVV